MTNIWYQNYLGLLKSFIFAFSAPPFLVAETLHVTYEKYKIKENLLFVFGLVTVKHNNKIHVFHC